MPLRADEQDALEAQLKMDARDERVEAIIEEAKNIAWASSPPGTIDALCEEQLRAVLRYAHDEWGVK